MRHSRFALLLSCLLAPVAAHAGEAPEETLEATLTTGPHGPRGAPDVAVHVPAGFDPGKPLERFVIFLHGYDGCTRALLASEPTPCRAGEPPHRSFGLARAHADAGTNTLLVVPQLAYLARTAHAHRFERAGAFDAMLTDVLEGALRTRLGNRTRTDVGSVTLVAHSAGYGATVSILQDRARKTAIQHVVMLDALYAGWPVLARWAEHAEHSRLVSLHTRQPQTVAGNRALAALLASRTPAREIQGSLEAAVRAHGVLIAQVGTAHGAMPEQLLADILRGLPLGRR